MLNITHEQASANIIAFCDAGTIVQGTWHGRGDDGREIACLLGAIHPQVKSAAECNGDLMPMWLAEMTPVLFDRIPADQIFPIARRYGSLVARWHVLSETQWNEVLTRVLIRCIDDAVAAARPINEGKDYWPAVAAAYEQSKAAIKSEDKDAAWAATWAAGAAAEAATWAAEIAAWAATWAAEIAAWAAAGAAAAYLSLFNFVLDQIELEIT